MRLEEICDAYNVTLCYYDGTDEHPRGFFEPTYRVIGVNRNLPEHVQKAVILHELGHADHSPVIYSINPLKLENEADRAMIRGLLVDYLEQHDKEHFNWLQFATYYNLNTTTDEHIIKSEFLKL